MESNSQIYVLPVNDLVLVSKHIIRNNSTYSQLISLSYDLDEEVLVEHLIAWNIHRLLTSTLGYSIIPYSSLYNIPNPSYTDLQDMMYKFVSEYVKLDAKKVYAFNHLFTNGTLIIKLRQLNGHR